MNRGITAKDARSPHGYSPLVTFEIELEVIGLGSPLKTNHCGRRSTMRQK
jgi:hypothetical protein